MYMWNGVGQHTNATQTSRAIASLYALIGDFDRQGGNVNFPKVPVNDVGGKEFLPKEANAARVGRERKPLGPPAKPGNCAAYDIFNAILDERPFRSSAVKFRLELDHVECRFPARPGGIASSGIRRCRRSLHDADGGALRLRIAGDQLP